VRGAPKRKKKNSTPVCVRHENKGFGAQVLQSIGAQVLHHTFNSPIRLAVPKFCSQLSSYILTRRLDWRRPSFDSRPTACVLCPVPCARCPLPCSLSPVTCATSPVPCALLLTLCPVPFALCPVCSLCPFILRPLPCAVCYVVFGREDNGENVDDLVR